MGRMEDRRWQRFERQGGPSRVDRLMLSQPLLVGTGMAATIGVIYLLVGRAFFGRDIDTDALADALLYSVVFTAVWLVLSRRTLGEAVQRWDAQAGADDGRAADHTDEGNDDRR